LRIISGKYKGKRINAPKKFSARPTTDFAKENLFNILANHYDFKELTVLDLFAGTGSISFEFASREALEVDMVEADRRSGLFAKSTAENLEAEQINIIIKDAFHFIGKCTKKYDIIFADPPYDMDDIDTLPVRITENNMLKDNGTFILEHSKTHNFSSHPSFVNERAYGNVHFSFFGKL